MLIRKQIFVHYGSIFINVSLTTKFQIEQYFYTLTVSSMYVDIQKKRFIAVLTRIKSDYFALLWYLSLSKFCKHK